METRFHTDNGNVIIENVSDCTPTVERCKEMHNAGLHGSSEMKHAASFDPVIIERYLNDNNITFSEWMGNPEHIRRMLNDPALSFFRIWKGRV